MTRSQPRRPHRDHVNAGSGGAPDSGGEDGRTCREPNVRNEDTRAALNQMNKKVRRLEARLNELSEAIDVLVNGGYVNDQRWSAFNESFQDFKAGVSKVTRGLHALARHLQ